MDGRWRHRRVDAVGKSEGNPTDVVPQNVACVCSLSGRIRPAHRMTSHVTTNSQRGRGCHRERRPKCLPQSAPPHPPPPPSYCRSAGLASPPPQSACRSAGQANASLKFALRPLERQGSSSVCRTSSVETLACFCVETSRVGGGLGGRTRSVETHIRQ